MTDTTISNDLRHWAAKLNKIGWHIAARKLHYAANLLETTR